VQEFERRINQHPIALADRLWVNNELDPEEEKLRSSRQTWFRHLGEIAAGQIRNNATGRSSEPAPDRNPRFFPAAA
jgi:hypothetical protein